MPDPPKKVNSRRFRICDQFQLNLNIWWVFEGLNPCVLHFRKMFLLFWWRSNSNGPQQETPNRKKAVESNGQAVGKINWSNDNDQMHEWSKIEIKNQWSNQKWSKLSNNDSIFSMIRKCDYFRNNWDFFDQKCDYFSQLRRGWFLIRSVTIFALENFFDQKCQNYFRSCNLDLFDQKLWLIESRPRFFWRRRCLGNV